RGCATPLETAWFSISLRARATSSRRPDHRPPSPLVRVGCTSARSCSPSPCPLPHWGRGIRSDVDEPRRALVGDGSALYVSARHGLALTARGCRTSIAHPTFRPSPSQLGHPVRAWTRRPCAS